MTISNFLMAWNKRYNVNYDINPWMTNNLQRVDTEKAFHQWKSLVKILEKIGAKVSKMSVDNELIPDIVFTANAGFIHNNVLILSNFKHSQRQQEIPYYRNWFLTNINAHLHVLFEEFEGAGDALIDAQNNIWVGYGFRSNLESHDKLKMVYPSLNIISLKLINPEFYHLDTCFCPLNNGYVLYYPDAFNDEGQFYIKKYFGNKVINVSFEDAKDFACNTVEWNGNLILNKCSPKLNFELEKIGYNVIETDLTEFLKAGGSAKCLTLKLTGN